VSNLNILKIAVHPFQAVITSFS